MSGLLQLQSVERIDDGGTPLAWIFRHDYEPEATEFPTPDEFTLQVGYVVYPAGGRIAPHRHRPIKRRLVGTSEVLFVKRGRAEAEFYAEDGTLVAVSEVSEGDILLLVSGGHGFRVLEDTVFVEVKQGPYLGPHEKERIR